MLFFLAIQLRVPMGHVLLATLVPSLLLSLLYIVYYVAHCTIDPSAAPQEGVKLVRPPGSLFFYAVRSLVMPASLIGVVLASIAAGWATPSQSGAVGAAGGSVLMIINRRFNRKLLHEAIVTTTLMTSMVFFVVIAANIFSYPFRYFGGDHLIAGFIQGLDFGAWGTLLTILLIIFLLGFFFDWIEITVITLPIFLPILESLDFVAYVGSPQLVIVWITVLIALVLQTSFLTPPFGFALFFVRGAAPPGVKMEDVYRGVAPLVAIQLATLLAVMLLPFLATSLPVAVAE